MPKIVDKNLMKSEIQKAALAAFYKYGYHNTTMLKIAQEANIAKGTLYLYFDSKDVLIETITDKHFEEIKNKSVPDGYFETLDELLTSIELLLSINEEESKLIVLFFEAFGENFAKHEFMGKYTILFDNFGKFYSSNLEYLSKNGKIDSSLSYECFGRALVSMLDGIVLHKSFFKIKNKEHKQMVKETIAILKKALA